MIGTVERNTGQVIEQVAHIAECFQQGTSANLGVQRATNHTLTSRLSKIAYTVAQTNFFSCSGKNGKYETFTPGVQTH